MRRWYQHGLNRPLSWRLVLRITPRLPRVVLLPLHHVATAACMLCMPSERAAARRNLRRVTGAEGLAGLRLVYRLFLNFSRFMVAYAEMREMRLEDFRDRLRDVEPTEAAIRDNLALGRGLILATMHVGQWDLGLKLLSRFEVPVHVVMLHEDAREVTQFADQARAWPGLKVHQMGDATLAVQLMAALGRGEIVAIQLDRPAGNNVMRTSFFGAPTLLPTGPVQLAMATGAPVLPVFVLLDRGNRYRLLALPALHFARVARPSDGPATAAAMERLVQVMETVVARHPDQWFNFYDVWPEPSARS